MTQRDRLFHKRMELIRDEDRLKIRVWEDEVKQGVFSKSDPTYTDFEEFHGWEETFYLVFKNPISHAIRYSSDRDVPARKSLQFAGKFWLGHIETLGATETFRKPDEVNYHRPELVNVEFHRSEEIQLADSVYVQVENEVAGNHHHVVISLSHEMMDDLENSVERGLANFGSLDFRLTGAAQHYLWSNNSIFAGESRYGFLDQLSAEENVEGYNALTSDLQSKLFPKEIRFKLDAKLGRISWSSGEPGELKDAWKDKDKYDPPFPTY